MNVLGSSGVEVKFPCHFRSLPQLNDLAQRQDRESHPRTLANLTHFNSEAVLPSQASSSNVWLLLGLAGYPGSDALGQSSMQILLSHQNPGQTRVCAPCS